MLVNEVVVKIGNLKELKNRLLELGILNTPVKIVKKAPFNESENKIIFSQSGCGFCLFSFYFTLYPVCFNNGGN